MAAQVSISATGDMTSPTSRDSTRRYKILIVGDWVIDEHWITSIHRSKTRSRTGKVHHRSIQRPEDCILTLAGAGKTTSILNQAFADLQTKEAYYRELDEATKRRGDTEVQRRPALHTSRFQLISAGIWHPKDERTLAHLLAPENAKGQTHFR